MRKIVLTTAIAMVMGSVSVAHAAETATLAVTGTINPAACNVTLSAASVDLGKIDAAKLANKANPLVASPISLNVACDAATAVAIQTTDNRSASALTADELNTEFGITSGAGEVMGLGTDSASNKIGVLSLGVVAGTLNGAENNNLLSSTDKSAWTHTTVSQSAGYAIAPNGYFSLGADAAATAPASATALTYSIQPGVILKAGSQYPTGETVNLDGNVTFSVVYL